MLYKPKRPELIEAGQITSKEDYEGFEQVCRYDKIVLPCGSEPGDCKHADCEYSAMVGYITVDGKRYYPEIGQYVVVIPEHGTVVPTVLVMSEADFTEMYEAAE